jgi:hypothetical protein
VRSSANICCRISLSKHSNWHSRNAFPSSSAKDEFPPLQKQYPKMISQTLLSLLVLSGLTAVSAVDFPVIPDLPTSPPFPVAPHYPPAPRHQPFVPPGVLAILRATRQHLTPPLRFPVVPHYPPAPRHHPSPRDHK